MPRPLGELEDSVMTRVWKWNRPVTVREVLEDLQQERSIAYTTVMTVLDNLHQKGWVRREAEGRAYRYEAVSTRAAYSAALMNEAWSRSDNPAAALVAFFGMMSQQQREALRDAVRIAQVPEIPAPAANVPAENPAQNEAPENTAGNSAAPVNSPDKSPENELAQKATDSEQNATEPVRKATVQKKAARKAPGRKTAAPESAAQNAEAENGGDREDVPHNAGENPGSEPGGRGR
ncbi:transcriptional repressor [Streptomyces albus]|uniref:Transcriptional repressor n=1 Tax=Streptomyces albus (strain ATCC 21838 / DSM 41398 / FERM P-419 / JCM 4703 / NBRC 107858) TaxID=1081613 RepID=A0A0B5ENR9_STRA4|nr:transcriptional repressor [Streptomyces albus]AOU77568.1 transcriptional repressor [Streptomyces albus]